jgi:uncharacterized protein YbaP (TraB family)
MIMRKQIITAIVALWLAPAYADNEPAQAASTQSSIAVLDEVLVTGEQPGPALWKVTKGEHTLWIMGMLSPLPKKMTWHSKIAETAIGKSQEIISVPAVSVGFFHGFRAIPQYIEARKNPDHATLQSVLPDDLYSRFESLKDRYVSRDNYIENLRPTFAAQELFDKAVDQSGMTRGTEIYSTVKKLAQSHRVKIHSIGLEIEDPKAYLEGWKEMPIAADIACLETTVARLETDIVAMRARANAWARGNMEGFRKLPYPDNDRACWNAMTSTPHNASLRRDSWQLWYEAVDTALANNRSTFTVLWMPDLLNARGPLAKLRAKGYSVDEP